MERIVRLREYLADCRRAVSWATPIAASGRLTRVSGLVMEAVGLRLPVGSQCHIQIPGGQSIEAEVAGFAGDRLFIMPATDIYGVMPGARVIPDDPLAAQPPRLGMRYIPRRRAQDRVRQVPVGDSLLGRVLDGAGRPLDGMGTLSLERRVPLYSRPINPLERAPIRQTLDVGVRAINGLLTVGRGQRLGLFAGSGVGKSILLGMMARMTEADIVVVGLIGERGREVKEFIDRILGSEGMARAVVVAAPADHPPLMRLNGAAYAMSIAEYFRDQGKHVLLIMDSLTRYAMAQREVALAIGEPPATKGYPPSVFAKLPQLAERAGNGRSGSGSITAFFTVLMEGDDQQDPIADAARAILDGHIVLSRDLADAGHYPAIDIEASISRAQPDLLSDEALERTRRFKYLYSRYMRSRDLLAVGAYVPGADLVLDEGVRLYPRMQGYLMQGMREQASLDAARTDLGEVLG
ncbi:MAG: flagellar protein export ATPase FliI [Thiobacillus sp. 63-78]|uniref:flagellar protein export ATPase FliI n=1 Tax=Thiobacillus sp. 63-78 TaxID=1895859 RepID=UPI000868C218|nr:flagellar protein export ATPase FliI [Thiobacillus sp. 63-78]MBN8767359.1 flagellar protein export ATPase FliI [Thiobacillus sp.]ODV12469.1 MAG: flagellar protein export ATPase FliI [Thiobacillus sp. SCN 64-317]OJZ14563.1 MAG: flagellar protein export ATPase FliI [Thiobacillus sp. 63-78]